MDRFYDAEEEENVWISFPSSDTNKVSEGDYIVLKKAHAKDEVAVQDNTSTVKYKVLDKQSNAPDYIKYKKEEIGISNESTTFSVGPQITTDDKSSKENKDHKEKVQNRTEGKSCLKHSISKKTLAEFKCIASGVNADSIASLRSSRAR